MKKRMWAVLLCLVMSVMAFSACGGQGETTEEPQQKQTETEDTEQDKDFDVGESAEQIRGGTNQDDAVLVPLNTKVYGTAVKEQACWLAFTTGEQEGAAYYLTFVNKTPQSSNLVVQLYDASGERLRQMEADNSGTVSAYKAEDLAANETYYVNIGIHAKGEAAFMMQVLEEGAQTDAYETSDSFTMARGAGAVSAEEIKPGTNMDDAELIPLDTKVSGSVAEGENLWFAFNTGAEENVSYQISFINKTPSSPNLVLGLFDQYGNRLKQPEAGADGATRTEEVTDLAANTTYYILLRGNSEYSLTIHGPQEEQTATAEALVFEKPFELNSTQVMFVANKATFLDEAAAKAALEPVAKTILAYPDHQVLIAGTTATEGPQETSVLLSEERAKAVKNMLVEAFGVPESQLLTVGLGFEKDPFVRGQDIDANGNFVETEAAKNRRVVLVDAEDPIAQKILQEK